MTLAETRGRRPSRRGDLPPETDVLVVGGGPAGLAAAIAARQHNLEVIVLDGAAPPIDKACGEGVMPNGVAALRGLGVSIPPHESMPFRGIRFVDPDLSVEANFRREPGRGIRRTTLHRLLIERAEAVGVKLAWQTRVRGLTPHGLALDTGVIASRWIVGADGEASQVRRWAGLGPAAPPRRFGFRQHFGVTPWTDVVEVYWCEGAQVVVTPVAPREVCVALISRDPSLRLDRLLGACPFLARRLGGAPATSRERGVPSTSRRLRAVSRDRVALVGEASGSLDGITGEGLSILFQQALHLGKALRAGDLSGYESAHRRVRRHPALVGRLLVAMDRSRWLRRRALRALATEPSLFSRLLAMHVGALTSPGEVAQGLCTLGWRLLTV